MSTVQASFFEKLSHQWDAKKFLCVGIDPVYDKIPDHLKKRDHKAAITTFCHEIIDATGDLVCAFKPNSAFFEQYGVAGWEALSDVVSYVQLKYPQVPIILDAKRADIGNTNNGYVISAFDELGVDAVTVNPYLGQEALEPFLARHNKGIFVLVKTSNPGSGEFQDLIINGGKPLYEHVAEQIAEKWNTYGNCAVVVGATYPQELKRVRQIIGNIPMLIPGIGVQGGDIKTTVEASINPQGQGIILNTSREVLYASAGKDFPEKAREKAKNLHKKITGYII